MRATTSKTPKPIKTFQRFSINPSFSVRKLKQNAIKLLRDILIRFYIFVNFYICDFLASFEQTRTNAKIKA